MFVYNCCCVLPVIVINDDDKRYNEHEKEIVLKISNCSLYTDLLLILFDLDYDLGHQTRVETE